MTRFAVEVRVMPRPSLHDPQGQTVEHALEALGFRGISEVRIGRALTFQFQVERGDRGTAERDVRRMCERLLANPVTEDFLISLREAP